VIADAHVHLFPDRVFDALWRWFDTHAWNVKYRLHSEEVVAFLTSRGVRRFAGLLYSHKPGMARVLNSYMAEVARTHPEIVPLGTVLPGEPDALDVVTQAESLGLRGLKLHCHVQAFRIDDPRLTPVFARSEEIGWPVVVHCGTAPVTTGYPVKPDELCTTDAARTVLQRHPRLKLLVPHLGADDVTGYLALQDAFENLWLDTTMAVSNVVGPAPEAALLVKHADRLLYGSDFPNIPYDWDHEIRWIRAQSPLAPHVDAILSGNFARLFGA